MVSKTVKMINSQGFHMRPASTFANAMGKHESEVTLLTNGKTVNGKSLMNIVASCIKCGDEVEIQCSGADEEATLAEALTMIENGFGEE